MKEGRGEKEEEEGKEDGRKERVRLGKMKRRCKSLQTIGGRAHPSSAIASPPHPHPLLRVLYPFPYRFKISLRKNKGKESKGKRRRENEMICVQRFLFLLLFFSTAQLLLLIHLFHLFQIQFVKNYSNETRVIEKFNLEIRKGQLQGQITFLS